MLETYYEIDKTHWVVLCLWEFVAKTIAIMDGSMLIQVQILYVNADINKRFNFKELEVEILHLITISIIS